jgi:CRISPR system Cascade subunit CasE
MALYLFHTRPDPVALTHWATKRHWLSPDGDFGYALHALLAEAFNGQAPSPFRYMNEQGLLAYVTESEATLRERLSQAAPDACRVLGLDSLRIKGFPSAWPTNKRLGFEVRVRPIIRTQAGKERDLYQYRMEQSAARSREETPSRERLYRNWLEQRFATDNAARLVDASMQGFRLSRVIRRPQAKTPQQRKPQLSNGPDALFKGELEVMEPSAFARLLARGIGRHRAFGYGMLLLKPAQRG